MIIFRILLMISALFLFLVVGLVAILFLKIRANVVNSFVPGENNESNAQNKGYNNDGKVIEGEYKVIDESHKD